MKKSILAFAFFCATSVAFANTPLVEDSSKKVEKTETSESAKQPKTTATCGESVSDGNGGTVYISTTGGNFFTSAGTAGARCAENLEKAIAAFMKARNTLQGTSN